MSKKNPLFNIGSISLKKTIALPTKKVETKKKVYI